MSNADSEAAFKTWKYARPFPETFGSLAGVRVLGEEFFTYRNHEHRRHSGVGLDAPPWMHDGSAGELRNGKRSI